MHSPSPFLIILLFLTTSLSDPGPITDEKSVLLRFKNSVWSDPADFLSKWDPNSDHCSFSGVTCSPSCRVVSLSISADISGEIPVDIWRLEDLELLYLAGNSLTGTLPPSFPPKLRVLNLASNLISGAIPNSLYNSSSLETLDLSGNRLTGSIPGFLQSFPKLREFSLSFNRIGGLIPNWIGNCPNLELLDLSGNLLVGGIPPNLGNCSKLQSLVLSSNLLDDVIPPDLGKLQKLQILDISRNSLSGTVPEELGNCSDLSVLVLSNLYNAMPSVNSSFYVDNGEFNNYEGRISERIAALPNLRILWVPRASLVGEFPRDWGACRSLEMVNLAQNFLTGEIPVSFNGCKNLKLVNLSSNNMVGRLSEDFPAPCLSVLDVSGNKLSGTIPSFIYRKCPLSPFLPNDLSDVYFSLFKYRTHKGISLLVFETLVDFLVYHNFRGNNFSGNLPSLPIATNSFGDQRVYAFLADGNSLVGSLNDDLFGKCNYLNGLVINLSKNMISGGIPEDIGTSCRSLLVLDVAGNRIMGNIPESFTSLGTLLGLDLSMNRLQGPIPVGFGELKGLRYLSLASNNLSGQIPAKLGQLHALNVLDLSLNYLSGEIPGSLASLKNLSVLLLNNNKLSGEIPSGFADVTSHAMFNLSCNNLSGSLSSNASMMRRDRVIGNPLVRSWQENPLSIVSSNAQEHRRGLQTYNEPPPGSSPTKGGSSRFSSIEIASIASASAILLVLILLVVLFIYTRMICSCSSADVTAREVSIFVDIGVPLTYESVVQATGNFNASNCIGSGGFGATYKAEVSPGVVVAIKRLSVGRIQGSQQFHAEIKTLGRWRHPNLVTLIGCHVGEAEMFLIYNYLPGGNLERFIQERSKRAVDWRMLHKIAFDIAKALSYLHDQCVPRILHRDVKPSNILLDNDFNAYLSDFGLARLLGNSETHATTGVAGTFGYVAPEYAMTCRVSDKADVYSYGVVLLELLSDKRALDPSFSPYRNGFNIVAWARMLLQQGKIHEFFAEGLWNVAPHDDLVEIMNLAIMCTDDSLSIRPTMNRVVQWLKELHPTAF